MAENRKIVVASLPQGKLQESDYDLVTEPVPSPGDGEVLCRTLAVSVDAGARAGLQGSATYAGAPQTGVVMRGSAVARVEASNDASVAGRGDRLLRRRAGRTTRCMPAPRWSASTTTATPRTTSASSAAPV